MTFYRYTRAWGNDLAEPAWLYVFGDPDCVLLKGQVRPHDPHERFAILALRGDPPSPATAIREIVPDDEVPIEIVMLLVEWRLTQ